MLEGLRLTQKPRINIIVSHSLQQSCEQEAMSD